MSIRVVGVKEHTPGWIAIELLDGGFVRAALAPTLYDVVAASSAVAVVGVGLPLGLLPDRWRAAEPLAAAQLGSLGRSIVPVPPRPVWMEPMLAAADKVCRELTGQRAPRPSRALRPRVLEANALWDRHPSLLVEAHPEVSFRAMAEQPLRYTKTTWTGQWTRRQLLIRAGIVLPDHLGPAGQAAPENILDAAAVAWSAHRVATGTALSYPSPPEENNGYKIAIWS